MHLINKLSYLINITVELTAFSAVFYKINCETNLNTYFQLRYSHDRIVSYC